jgi:hypothetical protein
MKNKSLASDWVENNLLLKLNLTNFLSFWKINKSTLCRYFFGFFKNIILSNSSSIKVK